MTCFPHPSRFPQHIARKAIADVPRRIAGERETVVKEICTMSASTHLESLEFRKYLAVTASFLPAAGVLSVFDDANNNTIVVSRDAAGWNGRFNHCQQHRRD